MSDEWSALTARARAHAALGDPGRLAIVDMLGYAEASPGEVARELRLPTNLVAHHLKVLESAGLIARTRSDGDRRRTYLRLVTEALPVTPPPAHWPAPRVVFVCTHNSARSPLAAALWARCSTVPAASAGTQPASRVNPRAVRVAHRHGISLDRRHPVHVAEVLHRDDLVITVCDSAHEHLQSGRRLHWSVPDPARLDTDEAFEAAYVDLAGRIDRLAPAVAPGVEP